MRYALALASVCLGLSPVVAQDGWRAGTGRVIITPAEPIWMSGYSNRNKPAEGKETELWAKTLWLQAGTQKLVLVSLDLVGIDREVSQKICARLEKDFDLPRSAICLATSHTHSGPVVGTNLRAMWSFGADEARKIDAYTTQLVDLVAQSVGDARAKLRPAKVAYGNGSATFAVNRRENKEADVPKIRADGKLKGPVDHDVMVLAVRDADDQLLGVAFGYSCHATVLNLYQWCGDYPGFAMIELEKKHPGVSAQFFAGCGADQNPLPRRSVELAREYGKQLADAVDRVLSGKMTSLRPSLASSYAEIPLPLRELPTRDALVQESMGADKYLAARAKLLLEQIARDGKLASSYPYPVQVYRLGQELDWVTLGGEVVVEYSLRLKKELTPGKTWVAGYAHDVMAYIPSLKVLKEGGYEGARSMIYYGLPSVWGERVEENIVAEVHRQAKSLAGK